MDLFDIVKATCDNIKELFPAAPIYIMQIPEGFKRPSFGVGIAGFRDADLCRDGLRRSVSLSITYFAPQDAKGIVNAPDQLAAYQRLLTLFQRQSLPVSDRHLTISRIDGGPRDSEIYLTVGLEYTFTPDLPDHLEPVDYELMQKLYLDYQE